jgi:hypothetical protein
MTDELIQRVDQELQDLAAEDGTLASQEEDVRRRRNEIRGRMAYLTNGLEFVRNIMERQVGATPEAGFFEASAVPTRTMTGTQTVADLSAEMMKQRGGTMKVRDILVELVKLGKLKGAKADYGTVFGTLSRNPARFRRVSPGEFELAIPREVASVATRPE